jgi:hypothetical protein
VPRRELPSPAPRVLDGCPRCAPGAVCASCAARRRLIRRLVDVEGESLEHAASRMRLSARFARELLTEERERRDLALHRSDFVDNAPIRALYERRLAREPELTLPELARLADIPCETYLARMLGYKPTSRAVREGRRYPGQHMARISVEHAGRIVRALGYAPAEIEGL